jgi:hypothetical protein
MVPVAFVETAEIGFTGEGGGATTTGVGAGGGGASSTFCTTGAFSLITTSFSLTVSFSFVGRAIYNILPIRSYSLTLKVLN